MVTLYVIIHAICYT